MCLQRRYQKQSYLGDSTRKLSIVTIIKVRKSYDGIKIYQLFSSRLNTLIYIKSCFSRNEFHGSYKKNTSTISE